MTMKQSILFVCLGNICRSPAAEAVFTAAVEQEGLLDRFDIDSAGTGGWHAGNKADPRMRKHAALRGIQVTSIARKFDPATDFDRFDHIVAMDDENVANLHRMARNKEDRAKISKMTDYRRKYNYEIVPDPYYGGDEGFELVLDLLEDAGKGLLDSLRG